MINHYSQSWEFYKLQTESFNEDFHYYLDFCENYKTLELFAGFGRLTNFLFSHKIDIEAIELEPNFSKNIKIPTNKIHTTDVLKFQTNAKFDRIIAAYNSFCLLTQNQQIEALFLKINDLLNKDGMASLSYYPLEGWKKNPIEKLTYKNKNIFYQSSFDLSQIGNNIAIWIDEYILDDSTFTFKYPTRVYSDFNELNNFLRNTDLTLIEIKKSYILNGDRNWNELIFLKK